MTTVGVAIPSFPARHKLLVRAVDSVLRQTRPVDQISVSVDIDGNGAPETRHRALESIWTYWVAFLDDDDEFGPEHIEKLLAEADRTGADYVYSWFHAVGGRDPFPQNFDKDWDINDPHQTTVTTLVRTELAKSVGGFRWQDDGGTAPDGNRAGEDFDFTLRCANAGAHITKLKERTWYWHHDSGNTSGMASRRAFHAPRPGQ
jgi:glycosyltransferase involved in cell wall biosynthesis